MNMKNIVFTAAVGLLMCSFNDMNARHKIFGGAQKKDKVEVIVEPVSLDIIEGAYRSASSMTLSDGRNIQLCDVKNDIELKDLPLIILRRDGSSLEYLFQDRGTLGNPRMI